jgi:hypothetical protein
MTGAFALVHVAAIWCVPRRAQHAAPLTKKGLGAAVDCVLTEKKFEWLRRVRLLQKKKM